MYEFEVRFRGIYTSYLFTEFLKDLFKDNLVENRKDISYIFDDNIRYIENSDGNIIKMQKNQLEVRQESFYKYTVSEEIKLDVEENIDIKGDDFKRSNPIVRSRSRDVYIFEDNVQLHITKVNEKYEVELELESNNISDATKFWVSFERFKEFITPHSFNLKDFLRFFNDEEDPKDPRNPMSFAKGFPKTYMDSKVIDRPRDIHKKDFKTLKDKTTGKNGEIKDRLKGIPEGYTLTIKGNGVPILLYQIKGFLYMISTAGKYFRLVNENSAFKSSESYIIIGEYFEESGADIGPIFAPFDILHYSREANIRYIPDHLKRMEIAKDIISRNKSIYDGIFQIYFKPFIKVGDTPESFAKAYLKIQKYKYPFGNDGLILTPIYTPHNNGEYRAGDTLSKKPSTCKIKPWHELSIDFRVDIKTEEVFASTASHAYKGSTKNIFDSKINVDWSTIPSHLDEKILELRPEKRSNPAGIPEDIKDSVIFVYSRHRDDKIAPNKLSVVNDVWDLINENIPETLYTGKDFLRLRQQNNKVKSDLISSIPKKSIVVDIGFGAGGDIDKYNGAVDIVIGVEPDESRRQKLYKRLEEAKSRLTTRFIVVKSGGEDIDEIMKELIPVMKSYPHANVAVVSMLSLTFFWKNRKMLDKLETTLKTIAREAFTVSGGSSINSTYFYFYTVEGNRFLKYFKEDPNDSTSLKIANYGIEARYDPTAVKYGVGIPGKVRLKIIDSVTVTETQTEFLVVLEDLKCLQGLEYQTGLIESYLTKEEHAYGQTHVYGKAKIDFTVD